MKKTFAIMGLLLAAPLATAALPASLVERFSGADLPQQLVAVLRFLSPLSKGR